MTEQLEWYDPKIEVPDAETTVLVQDADGDVGAAVYDDEYDRWEGPGGYAYAVRYWAHMPAGPEVKA